MEKRMLTALALSFLVVGLYPVVLEKFFPELLPKKVASTSLETSKPLLEAKMTPPTLSKAEELSFLEDVAFKNRKLELVFNQKGGGIRQIVFSGYVDSESKAGLKFLSLQDSKALPTAVGVALSGRALPQAAHKIAAEGSGVFQESAWQEEGLALKKEYRFSDEYSADLTVTIKNTGSKPVPLQYEVFAGGRISPRHSIDSQYIEANFFASSGDKKLLKHVNESGLGKEVRSQGFVDWVAVKDRHFAIVIKPKDNQGFTGLTRGFGNHEFSASLVSRERILAPGESLQESFTLYIGPNLFENLQGLGMEDMINFGKMDGIAKVLVGTLELLHQGLHNYGLAIIVLTLLINLLLFPMTRISYMSMKRMQLIQPQIMKLREQYKKNPERLNKETMELYKKHKVNPFGGCLPMLLQMPVFIALYVALSKSVALINARFLWATDLSSPDSVSLPFALPFIGSQLHVLPLIMVLAMVVQQKLTQVKMEGQDPAMETQQKMMAVMMPIIFGFIFYSMPSGLVIYWLTNTLLMTLYQAHLKKVTLT